MSMGIWSFQILEIQGNYQICYQILQKKNPAKDIQEPHTIWRLSFLQMKA